MSRRIVEKILVSDKLLELGLMCGMKLFYLFNINILYFLLTTCYPSSHKMQPCP